MIRVKHIIAHRGPPFILDSNMTAAEASSFLLEHHIGGAPVVKGKDLVGFCSERDIVYRVVAAKRDPDATRVSDIMSANVLSGSPKDSAVDCENRMRERHVRHMPIVEDGVIVACISLRNLLQSELSEYKLEVESLTEYIRGPAPPLLP